MDHILQSQVSKPIVINIVEGLLSLRQDPQEARLKPRWGSSQASALSSQVQLGGTLCHGCVYRVCIAGTVADILNSSLIDIHTKQVHHRLKQFRVTTPPQFSLWGVVRSLLQSGSQCKQLPPSCLNPRQGSVSPAPALGLNFLPLIILLTRFRYSTVIWSGKRWTLTATQAELVNLVSPHHSVLAKSPLAGGQRRVGRCICGQSGTTSASQHNRQQLSGIPILSSKPKRVHWKHTWIDCDPTGG